MQRGRREGSFSMINGANPQHLGKLESAAPMKNPHTLKTEWGFFVGRLSECQLNLAEALTLGLAHGDGYIVAKP